MRGTVKKSRSVLPLLVGVALSAALVVAAFLWVAGGRSELAVDSVAPSAVGSDVRAVEPSLAAGDAGVAQAVDSERLRLNVNPDEGEGGAANAALDVHVVSLVHGGPLPEVEVHLYERRDPAPDAPDRRMHAAATDREGRVRFEADASVLWGLSVNSADDHGYGDLDLEPLAPGERREVELLVPTVGDVIWFGRVTRNGEPLAGALVRMLDVDDADGHLIDEVESDSTGLVQFAGSSWKGLDARVDVPGVGLTITEVTPGHETPEEAQELPLWPVGSVNCIVVDPGGAPLSGIDVLAVVRTYEVRPPSSEHAYTWSIRVRAVTDTSGVTRLVDVPARLPINIELRRGGELLLEEKRAFIVAAGSDMEREFVLGGVGRIFGRVESEAGTPLAGVPVDLSANEYVAVDDLFYTARLHEIAAHSMTTDAVGRFDFKDVPYGAWYVGSPGGGDDPEQYVLARRIELSASEPSAEVTLRLARGLMIEGWVVDPGGEGVAGVFMQSWNMSNGGLGRLQTDVDGAFAFGPMPAGLYSVFVESPDTYVGFPAAEVLAGTTDLRFVLEPGLVLRGTVVDAVSGVPIDVAEVYAHAPASAQPYRFHGTESVRGGRFELNRLPAGEIALKATTEDGGIGILRGIQVQPGAAVPDVTIRLHRGVPVRVRYVGAATGRLAIQGLQDGVAVTYIAVKPGEMTTFWAMPGPLLLRADGEGVVAEDKELVIEPGDHPEVVLGDDS